MSDFKFRFAALQRIREHRLDECRQVLARMLQELGKYETQAAEIEAERNELLNVTRRQGATGAFDVQGVVDRKMYATVLKRDIAQARAIAAQIEQQIEAFRETLADAHRDVRVLEKLEEKEREQFLQNEIRRTQLRLEDAYAAIQRSGVKS